MDRDRRPPRRDEAFPDQYRGGGGQSYRPGGARERSPEPRGRTPLSGPPPTRPAGDTYRARSPARRPDYNDSYRGPPRPRSRSPVRRDEYPRRRTPEPPRYRDERDVRDVRDVREARDGRGDTYRGRPRSPPPSARREELPRDDLFRRDPPPRDYGRDDRGGYAAPRAEAPRYRERSPLPLKRGRDPSPIGSRGRRTPPPAKRERINSPPRGRYDDYPPSRVASPPRRRFSPDPRDRRPASPQRDVSRGYRRGSRSPLARQERVDPRTIDDWRKPRSPSPMRYNGGREYEMQDQGRSVATSRQSSPPIHASRQLPVDDRAGRAVPLREPYEREPYRQRSPERAAPRAPNDYNDDRYARDDSRVPPPREPKRSDDITLPVRAPPTGPSGYRAPSGSAAPPSGPAASTVPISAHQRAPIAPPSGPRAAVTAPSAPRGDFVPRGRGSFRGGFGGAPFRGGRGGAPGPGFGRGESFQQQQQQSQQPPLQHRESFDSGAAPPTGPRSSFGQSQAPPVQSSGPPSGPGGFRQSNNSSTTSYPRTQRFAPNGAPIPDGPSSQQPTRDSAAPPSGPRLARRPTEPFIPTQPKASVPGLHPSLSDLATIVPGGQKADPLVDLTRLHKLQEEAEKLRKDIEVKEQKKRKNLRDWERMGREVEVAGLRSELAEQAVRGFEGEGEGQAAF